MRDATLDLPAKNISCRRVTLILFRAFYIRAEGSKAQMHAGLCGAAAGTIEEIIEGECNEADALG
jgi:hypothetical protein